ncbi:peroxiredoxin family protein [Neobacillus ginsengisoli]|uniref:Peroxiredoxin n=1 Tax=Neobacillus ginsengisoli TaxID=904295 RepID=A0ABT9XSL4_9BACI|nr:TlpA disulfide reductase family protein [Neobacillus ginsengisoli]MDQ0197922.1 peroxiredoxin [Neobacillus ginsengisoli]
MKKIDPMIPPIVLLIGLLGWAIFDQNSKINTESHIEKPSISAISKDAEKLGIQKGNMAPDFKLTTINGDDAKLSNYKGKKVILNFWATWCPPCKAEMPNIEEYYKENKDKNVIVLAVNLTTAEKNKDNIQQFIKDHGLTFPVLLDEKGNAGNLYQAFTIPTSYFIDIKGIVQQKIVGPMSKETIETLVSKIN